MKDFINILKGFLPEIEERMNDSKDLTVLDNIEQVISEELPKDFRALYSKYNGEKNAPFTGIVLGFSLMAAEHILKTIESFQEDDFSEITSLTTGKVTDEKMCDRIMIPFGWDGSRGFLCLDLSPDTEGKKGQVVALDYDYNECTWLADSLEDFFSFIHKMLKVGKCYVDKVEEPYFSFESGHFFNVMKDILEEFMDTDNSVNVEIDLPNTYWRDKFGADKVSVNILKKQTSLRISNGEMPISLEPVAHMAKLRELIIHNCVITDFERICEATELKELILVNCSFEYEKLISLTKLTKLKQLTLRFMPVKDIGCLAESKSLKKLRLLEMNQLDVSNLSSFTKLQELELEEMDIDDLDFLKGYKSLKVLVINNMKVKDLEFLQYLKKLTCFTMEDRAKNEEGLRFIKSLLSLKQFEYPVGDMVLYAGCEKLEDIGIDATGFKNPEALKDSNIARVMVYNANSEEEAESVIDRVEEYVELYS